MKNRLRTLLREGGVAVGAWVGMASIEVSEILANAGFDFLIYDMEHSPLSFETVSHLMAAAGSSQVTPLLRVAWNDPVLAKRGLDIGAHGVVFPWVNTAEEATRAVQACKYPPDGIRGLAVRRASRYGLDSKEYLATANSEIMVIVQIETLEAVQHAEAILSAKGVDAYFVGPSDLSASMGLLGQPEAPAVLAAIEKVLEIGKNLRIPGGVQPTSVEAANRWIESGFQLIPVGADSSLLMGAAREAIRKIERPPLRRR